MAYRQLKTPNLDPVIYVGSRALTSWAGWCLAYVEVAFGTLRLYPSAWQGWQDTKKKHPDRNFPRDVYFPVWFSHHGSYGSPPTYGNWGHVAIAKVSTNGSMTIWSSPASAKPYADTYSSIEQVVRMYSSTYVGWSEDIARTQIIQLSQGGTHVTREESFQRAFITQAHRWPTKAETEAWLTSGLEDYTWVQRHAPDATVNDQLAMDIYYQASGMAAAKAKQTAINHVLAGTSFKQVITTDMKNHYLPIAARVKELEEQTESMTTTIDTLEESVFKLNDKLETQDKLVGTLIGENKKQQKTIDDQTTKLGSQRTAIQELTEANTILKDAAKNSDPVTALDGWELVVLGIRKLLRIKDAPEPAQAEPTNKEVNT